VPGTTSNEAGKSTLGPRPRDPLQRQALLKESSMDRTVNVERKRSGRGVQRISVSLPDRVFRQLDEMVAERGMENRSKAIAEMISDFALRRQRFAGNPVLAGMIVLVYDESKGNLVYRLFKLERQYLDEVISSMHVQLEDSHRMQVLVVQGPMRVLREITGRILAHKGVVSCKLTLVEAIIPQIHSRPPEPTVQN
jgi:CopG family nickel-responsive transcriptional regulator